MEVSYGSKIGMFRLDEHHRQLVAAVQRLAYAEMGLSFDGDEGATHIVTEVREFLEILCEQTQAATRAPYRWVRILPDAYARVERFLPDLDEDARQGFFEAFVNVAVLGWKDADVLDRNWLEQALLQYSQAQAADPVLRGLTAEGDRSGATEEQLSAIRRALKRVPTQAVDGLIQYMLGLGLEPLRDVASEFTCRRLGQLETEREAIGDGHVREAGSAALEGYMHPTQVSRVPSLSAAAAVKGRESPSRSPATADRLGDKES